MRALKLLIIGALGAASLPAAAQELEKPTDQQGYYVGGGVAIFGAAPSADDPDDVPTEVETLSGLYFRLRAGEMITPHFGLGLNLDLGSGRPPGNDEWYGLSAGLGVEARYRPWTDRGWAFHAGLGAGGAFFGELEADQNGDRELKAAGGVLWRAGASYTVFPWYEAGEYQSGGGSFNFFIEAQALIDSDMWMPVLMVGVEFLYWTGIDRNKLDLPPEAAFARER